METFGKSAAAPCADALGVASCQPAFPESPQRVFPRDPSAPIIEPLPPWPVCTVTVAFPQGLPEAPTISASKGCPDAQVALALSIMVTALLRAAKASAGD
jgi:hypothetical protein